MFSFTATPLTQADRAEIYNHTDEICDGWRFRLSLSISGSQAQYYNVLHRDLVKHLLDPEVTLNYNDTPCVYVCEGWLRQIPREHFARALFDVIISEIPEKHWSIQIWNTREREWHSFMCNYHVYGYELIWRTTAKDFTFNHVDISESLWLHAAHHGGVKSVNLLVDYEPEEQVMNGSYISSGATAVVNSGQTVYGVMVMPAGSLIVSSGGSVVQSHVGKGGLLTVMRGAIVCEGAVSGALDLHGSAREVAIHGRMTVVGEAHSCTVTGHGRACVKSGGVMKFGKVLSGGTATVMNDGHMYGVEVRDDGVVVAEDGSTVDRLIVSSGGFVYVSDKATVDLVKRSGGRVS